MRHHAIGMGTTACPWCNTDMLAYQHEGGGGDVYRCLACKQESIHVDRVIDETHVCGVQRPNGRNFVPCVFVERVQEEVPF